jgi:hypothetical protein
VFKWIAKKAANIQREEASRFLESLRGADQAVLDMSLATAMYWACFYLAKRNKNLYEMAIWIDGEMLFPMTLISDIKALQRNGTPASAVGLHVWVHSARALLYPELRLLGRNIWSELGKADLKCRDITVAVCQQAGIFPIFVDPTLVPAGLEELDR